MIVDYRNESYFACSVSFADQVDQEDRNESHNDESCQSG